VILDDLSCLLYLVIEGRLLNHMGSLTKDEGALVMMGLIGSRPTDIDKEVTQTRGVRAHITY
jgi:hypothetical protein